MQLFDWSTQARVVDRIVGLHGVPVGDHRDVPAETLEFDCAVRLTATAEPPLPPPLRTLWLGGGEYACIRHVGSFLDLETATDRLLAEWLPTSGYALRDAPIYYDYHDDPDVVPEALLRTDILVPVQAQEGP